MNCMANQQHLDLLKQGVETQSMITWNLWREELTDVQLDLSGADLSGVKLGRAHLSRADLSAADLSEANLVSARLRSADLSGALQLHLLPHQ
jgi:uncharacterized protein YjbI with pentapeptide repeats